MNNIRQEMTFKGLIEKKKKAISEFTDEICSKLGNMPLSTYWWKVREDKFTLLEKTTIAEHLKIPVEILFPKS